MSIPPNIPPGGYNSSPPKSSSGTGWKIAGFGCLSLFVLAAVGGVLLVRSFKTQLDHPSKSSIVGLAALAGQASIDGSHLRQAVVAYHTQHGTYPKSLMDLYNDGSIDGKLLHNGLDDSPDPAHLSWRYTRPAENAPGNTPILEEPYNITFSGSTQPGKIVIALDGRSLTNTSRQTDAGSQTNGGSN
ncbi:MAG: hypothetical protein ACRYFS_20250 [Janthinobacterium lividum]